MLIILWHKAFLAFYLSIESEEEKGTGENNAPVSKKQRKGKVVAIDGMYGRVGVC